VQEGQTLAGKYRVDRVLGVGGTGTVFAAHHLQLDTPVAIKFLRPSLLTNQEAVASFVREARAALQMHNEHVARVFDVGTLVTGAPYMVMEFLDGADLGKVLQKRGPLSVEEAVDFVLQACEGLAEAHALGIVHRDLKPTNLFCIRRPDGRPIIKVLDFGISEVMGLALQPPTSDQEQTGVAALTGSPLYMSPEQIDSSTSVDARTDIWALGVILYELLSDRTPFFGDTLPEVSTRITAGHPRPLDDLMSPVPEGLLAVIETCLQKDRGKRYPNVAALGLALLPFGPKRARVSVDRISDTLQAAVAAADLSAQGAQDTSGPASEQTAPSPSPWPSPSSSSSLSLGAASEPSATRPARGFLAIAGVLGLLGAGVGAATFALLSKRRAVHVDEVMATRVFSQGPAGGANISVAAAPPPPPAPVPIADDNSEGLLSVARSPVISPQSTASRLDVSAPPDNQNARQRGRVVKPMSGFVRVGRSSPSPSPSPSLPGSRAVAVKTGASTPGVSVGPWADCNPTFELDDQGRKHFKPECLTARPGPPSATARAAANCDPTFELDDQGRKHFKPECFVNSKR
jgi:eukaryotic-like serine/threonine-protein kinase